MAFKKREYTRLVNRVTSATFDIAMQGDSLKADMWAKKGGET